MSDNKAQNNDINQIIATNIKEESGEKEKKPKQNWDDDQESGNLSLKERMLYLKENDQVDQGQNNSKKTIDPNQSFFEQIRARKQAKQNDNQNTIDKQSVDEQNNNEKPKSVQKTVNQSYNDNYQINEGIHRETDEEIKEERNNESQESKEDDINENWNNNDLNHDRDDILSNSETISYEETKNYNHPLSAEKTKQEDYNQDKEAEAIQTAVINKLTENKKSNHLKKEVKHTAAAIPYRNQKSKNKIQDIDQEQKSKKSGYFVWGHYFAFILTLLTLFFMFFFSNVIDYYQEQIILVNILNTLFISGMFFLVFNKIIYYCFSNVHQKRI